MCLPRSSLAETTMRPRCGPHKQRRAGYRKLSCQNLIIQLPDKCLRCLIREGVDASTTCTAGPHYPFLLLLEQNQLRVGTQVGFCGSHRYFVACPGDRESRLKAECEVAVRIRAQRLFVNLLPDAE